MKCENCGYYYTDVDGGSPSCHFVESEWLHGITTAPCEMPDPEPVHYTVKYNGCWCVADKCSGINSVDTDSWEEAIAIYHRLEDDGIDVWLNDNWYGMTFQNGEWS